jgi:hypothetical protein
MLITVDDLIHNSRASPSPNSPWHPIQPFSCPLPLHRPTAFGEVDVPKTRISVMMNVFFLPCLKSIFNRIIDLLSEPCCAHALSLGILLSAKTAKLCGVQQARHVHTHSNLAVTGCLVALYLLSYVCAIKNSANYKLRERKTPNSCEDLFLAGYCSIVTGTAAYDVIVASGASEDQVANLASQSLTLALKVKE